MNNFKRLYPNASMSSEWDVIAEIRTATAELGPQSTPRLTHILGHQDELQQYQDLPLPAQLNCDADALAGAFLAWLPFLDCSTVPILPTSGCQLALEEGTVTFNVKQQLKLARSTPPLRDYMCEKNGWCRDTFEDIDWTSHSRALRRHDKHRETMVKHMHNILPVGKQVHRYDPKYPECCPSCPEPLEDHTHFWCCPAPSRQAWRRDCYKAVFKCLEDTDTALPLQSLLLDALDVVLFGKCPSTIQPDPSVQHIADAQAAIGWSQIIKGRFSKSWAEFQHAHMGPNVTARKTGTAWMTKVIDVLFAEWWTLWNSRNGDRHGRDLASQREAEAFQAIRELNLLYDTHQLSVIPRLQWLFEIPLLTRMQWQPAAIRQWLNTWKPVIEESYTTQLQTG
jgi:hypothetical protein